MVPSDHISQNMGSNKSKSNYFRKKYYWYKKNSTTILVISISSADLWLHKKIKEHINVSAIFVNVVVER